MTLGIALVVIFILYLIDKNHVWRQAVKVVIGFAILGVLVIASFYGWISVREWREAKAAQKAHEYRKQDRAADHEKRVDACMAREVASSPPEPAGFTLDRSMCEENPDREWGQPQSDSSRAPSVLKIRGGDTLQITPVQTYKTGKPDFIPLVYLGRHQVYLFACGHYGETQSKDSPTFKGNTASCP